MMAERTDSELYSTGNWPSVPATEPDVRSRWLGIVPALLMAVVVAGPSIWVTWRILASDYLDQDRTQTQIVLFLLGPLILSALLLIPSLAVGRWPGRMTALPGRVWLAVAALLFLAPGLGLASIQAVDQPTAGPTGQSVTSVDWEFGLPGGGTVVAALFVALLIAGIGCAIGYWARGIGRAAAILAVPVSTMLCLLALALYIFASIGSSLGAQSEPSPDVGLLELVPLVTWIAAPAVAVLAGAELGAEEERR